MKSLQSQKYLTTNPKGSISFYRNFTLRSISPQPRIKNTQKSVVIEKNPWGKCINNQQIQVLLKRLNDTPATLYKAFQMKKQSQRTNLNRNKFKPLKEWEQSRKQNLLNRNSIANTQKIMNKNDQKQLQVQKQQKILKKIQTQKKKYIEEYRKMILGMKSINLDTDLPRIKYIEQNQRSNAINQMNAHSKNILLR